MLEIATAHGVHAHVLQVVQLLLFLFLGIAIGLDGLAGVEALQLAVALNAEGLTHHGAVGGIGPGCHSGASGLEHHSPVFVRIGHTLRVSLAIAYAQEKVYFVPSLVQQVGDAVARLPNAEVVFR